MKKPALIILSLLLLIATTGGFIFFWNKLKKSEAEQTSSLTTIPPSEVRTEEIIQSTEEPTPTLKPLIPTVTLKSEDLGPEVKIIPRADKKAITLLITKIPQNVNSVSYELTYDANGIPRGVVGKIDLIPKQTEVFRELVLGVCSGNVCLYDAGVKKVKVQLRFMELMTTVKEIIKDLEL